MQTFARWTMLAAVAVIGCESKASVDPEHPVLVMQVAPALSESSPPGPVVQVFSIASFAAADRLSECIDVSATATRAPGMPSGGHDDAFISSFVRDGAIRLGQACVAQFRDRAVLATCSVDHANMTTDSGVVRELSVVSRYYDYASVGESDAFMKQCLEMHGKWEAIAHDSIEFKRARLRFHAEQLKNLGR